MRIEIDIKNINELRARFGNRKVNRATQIALNRTARKVKTETVNILNKKWNIQKQDLNRKISVAAYPISSLKAEVVVRGKPISLIYFRPTAIKQGIKYTFLRAKGQNIPRLAAMRTRARDTGGVVVEIHRTKKTTLKKVFFITTRQGVSLAVIRRSDNRLQKVSVITEASMFRQVKDKVMKAAIEAFQKEFKRQVEALYKYKADWLS
ncbi:hypothetical protein KEJ32_00990 [Candidatus Bathyarchaeota archaeon]|nr:hypothetical protein [Candidatus Bathyarchaeota archaeon]